MLPSQGGSSLQRGSNIRAMVRGIENLTHKCAGTTSNKIGSIFLHQKEKSENHALSNRQKGSLVLPFKNEGNEKCTYDQINQRDLALFLNHNMSITAEYLPSVLNTVTDRESRENRLFRVASSSQSFQAVSCLLGSPTIDEFASCLCHQLTKYIAWHPSSYSQGTDAVIQNWSICLPYAFPSFSMISWVLLEIKQECVLLLILIAPVWSTQPWYPERLNLCVREPMLLAQGKEILISPKNIIHLLMVENSVTLVA